MTVITQIARFARARFAAFAAFALSIMTLSKHKVALLELFRILVDQWAQNLNGVSQTHWLVFLPVFSTALLWFFLRPMMSWLQRVFVAY